MLKRIKMFAGVVGVKVATREQNTRRNCRRRIWVSLSRGEGITRQRDCRRQFQDPCVKIPLADANILLTILPVSRLD